ncbi:MAG: ribulose-phosphate 3-epimerase [Planctomycetes bacterium]|nr:ribulose-phosphate 3-epimerase [Planctomycetota bacterium]
MRLKVAPSILSAAFERLGEEVRAMEEAGADQIHVDVMDGHFVPNISMGPVVVEALRRATRLPLDVHLMITDPERYLEPFVAAGAHHITFHIEACGDPAGLARRLRERGIGAGLALNPATPAGAALDLLPHFDLLLVMTVNPGFGGQPFLGDNLGKVRAIRERERGLGPSRRPAAGPLDIEVDGGIDARTARLCREAGANVFVAGNAIFRAPDPRAALRELRRSVADGAETE